MLGFAADSRPGCQGRRESLEELEEKKKLA
jgi:hypothetical protein